MKLKQGALVASLSRNAGGLFHSVRQLSLAMNKSPDIEVEVFGLGDEYVDQDLDSWTGVKTHVLGQLGPRVFGCAPQLHKALLDANLDILHVHGIWMYPSIASRRWSAATNKPYVISPHGMLDPWAVNNSGWKKRLAGLLYEDGHLHGAACVRALCESEAQSVRGYGLRNPVCIIPNGVDIPSTDVPDIAPPWIGSVPAGSKLLLYLGRLHPKKGLPNLLGSWADFHRSSGVSGIWHLFIAGWDQGGHEQELKALAKKLGIEASVHFIGPQFGTDKDACYRHADAFILPSFSEGLPMVVLEAWAYGLPVVMTPQCNLPEGFAAGAAVCIEPESGAIAEGLKTLFEMSDQDRAAMGARGLQLVKDKFTWPRIAGQMLDVYQWILGQGARPECVDVV